MRELIGNIWTKHPHSPICITTNGSIRKDGRAVMGRGIALQAAIRFPTLPHLLGDKLRDAGNSVFYFEVFNLFTLPVKHAWDDRLADLALLSRSVGQLAQLVPDTWPTVYMPRPGCGVGGLKWADVAREIAPILDDRFTVMDTAEMKQSEKY